MNGRNPPPVPILPELGPVQRAHIGPFLLLGVGKDADKEAIEAGWAKRLIWARKNLIDAPLEDINWARDLLSDPVRRVKADAASLNLDTVDGTLKQLQERFQSKGACQPIDVEKSLAHYTPPTPVPDPEEVLAGIPTPQIPHDVPAVAVLLEQFVRQPLDPWNIDID